DVVLPGPGSPVGDGDTIVLNRARPLALTVDGVRSDVYTTAHSVDGALDELGYRAENLVLSASRSERLPLNGMDLSIATSKDVTPKGAKGEQTVTWRVTTTDGVETGREQIGAAVTKPAVDEQVAVGSKAKPAAPAATDAPAATADGLNWAALAKCESGGNPRAV